MPHSINSEGEVTVNLDDYNYLSTVRHRERIQAFSQPLSIIEDIKYFSIVINFADGKRFSISNMPLWAIPYYTLGYFRADFDIQPGNFTQSYFIHTDIKYDPMQSIILNDLRYYYKIYPTFAIVRKCIECEIIAEAYHEININEPLKIYKKCYQQFENFCVNFIEKNLDLIQQACPTHRYDRFIHNKDYRRNVFLNKNVEQKLTSRERECILWASLGKTSEETGIILGVSKRTVEALLNNAKQKLGCNNIANLIANCIKYSLLE